MSDSRNRKSTESENEEFESSSAEQATVQPTSWMSSLFTAVVGSSSSSANVAMTKTTSNRGNESGNIPINNDVPIEKLKEHIEGTEDDVDFEDEEDRRIREESDKESKQQLWKQVYSYMGSNLSGMRFSLPIRYFEPTTVLTRMAEAFEFSDLLDRAAITNDCVLRDSLVTAFVVSTFSNTTRTRKPLNPILGETYEFLNPVSDMKLYAEQVSHHPPISVSYVQGNFWEASEVINVHGKFQGNSMDVSNSGYRYISLLKFNDYYTWTVPTCSISNIFVGKTNIDYHGSINITNHYTGNVIHLTFSKSGWFGTKQYDVHGHLADKDGNQLLLFKGAWNKYLDSCPVATDEVKTATTSLKNTEIYDENKKNSNEEMVKSARVKINEVERRERELRFATSPRKLQRRVTKPHVEHAQKGQVPPKAPSSLKPTVMISPASAPVTPRVVHALPKSILNEYTGRPKNSILSASSLASSSSSTNVHRDGAKNNDKTNGTGTDGSNRLWVAGSHLLSAEEGGGPNDLFSSFTRFTKRTIAFDNDYATELPPTDSRLRPDRIALEHGNLPIAGDEKKRIEQLQRDRRHAAKKIMYRLNRDAAYAENGDGEAVNEGEEDGESPRNNEVEGRENDDQVFAGEDGGSNNEYNEEDTEENDDMNRIKWILESQRPKYFRQTDEKGDKWEPLGTYWRDSRSYMDDDEKRLEASMW